MVNGDRSQIDLPTKQKSGLLQALDILRDVRGIGFVEMTAEDVVRHRLVKEIVYAYDRYDTQTQRDQANRPPRDLYRPHPDSRPESDFPAATGATGLPVNQEQQL
jgi:phosphate starvation-inducible PhoH-like protein